MVVIIGLVMVVDTAAEVEKVDIWWADGATVEAEVEVQVDIIADILQPLVEVVEVRAGIVHPVLRQVAPDLMVALAVEEEALEVVTLVPKAIKELVAEV